MLLIQGFYEEEPFSSLLLNFCHKFFGYGDSLALHEKHLELLVPAHPGLWISSCTLPVSLFHIFTKSKLDSFRCIFKNKIFERSPTKLDDRILSSNWICRTMQNIGSSRAPHPIACRYLYHPSKVHPLFLLQR